MRLLGKAKEEGPVSLSELPHRKYDQTRYTMIYKRIEVIGMKNLYPIRKRNKIRLNPEACTRLAGDWIDGMRYALDLARVMLGQRSFQAEYIVFAAVLANITFFCYNPN